MDDSALNAEIDPSNTRGWPKTRRQLEWAKLHVIEGRSAHEAALRAGYARSTARSKSFQLQERLWPFISHLQEHKNSLVESQLGMTVDRVLEEIASIALSRISDYVSKVTLTNGTTGYVGKSLEQLSKQERTAVKRWTVEKVETNEGVVLSYHYELEDKVKALMMLARHMGFFNEKYQMERLQRESREKRKDMTQVPSDLLEEFHALLEKINGYANRSAPDTTT